MSKVNNPAAYRARKREQRKNFQKRKRNEDVGENLTDVAKKIRKTQLNELIENGYKDLRKHGRKCSRCNKLCIKADELTVNTILKEDETSCGSYCNHKTKRIIWQTFCSTCVSERQKISLIEGTNRFDGQQVNALMRHLSMTPKDRRDAMNQLREQFGGKCAACGIQTIRGGKSGFRQESFTDMFPKSRPVDNPSCEVKDLRLVCLACQNFQNDLNWNEIFDAFVEIQQAPHKPKNLTPLSQKESRYLLKTKCRNGKSEELKRKLFDRDGRHCQYTGVEMKFEPDHWNSVSFDRFDPQQDYTFENIHLVCQNINYIKKQSITQEELLAWIEHIRGPKFVFNNTL